MLALSMRRVGFELSVLGAVSSLGLCLMLFVRTPAANTAKRPPEHRAGLKADASAPCLLPNVLEGAANRAQELLTTLERFSARDWLQEDIIDRAGFSWRFADTYDYAAYIEHPAPNQLVIRELRHSDSRAPKPEGFTIADGLPAIGLIFSDEYSKDYLFQCDGASEQHGKAAWKVSFEQRQDREPRIWAWNVGGHSYMVRLRGHAWIAAGSYELLRVEADLMAPPPGLGLDSAHMVIDFAPVNFPQRHEQVWLILSAEISDRWAGNQLKERHEFSHFTLFSVKVESKITPR
jgi:hypothetical protein